MKKILLGVVIAVVVIGGGFFGLIILGVALVGGRSDSPSQEKSPKVSENINTEVSVAPLKDTFAVGEPIELDNVVLTATKVTRGYDSGNQFMKPKTGEEFIVIDLELKNNRTSNVLYNAFDFKVQDSNGSIETIGASTYSLDNYFDSGELAPGGKKTGQVLFEVPANDKSLVLMYDVSFWGKKQIKINL